MVGHAFHNSSVIESFPIGTSKAFKRCSLGNSCKKVLAMVVTNIETTPYACISPCNKAHRNLSGIAFSGYSQQTITLKVADQGRSDFYVVLP